MELPEIRKLVFSFIDCGSTYKSVSLVSRTWHFEVIEVLPEAYLKFAKYLGLLFGALPSERWDWNPVCTVPKISWDIVEKWKF